MTGHDETREPEEGLAGGGADQDRPRRADLGGSPPCPTVTAGLDDEPQHVVRTPNLRRSFRARTAFAATGVGPAILQFTASTTTPGIPHR
jgi:hypothetical protein